MEDFFQDIRYGIRVLRNKPGFAAVAVLTLALGIGANTAIFSVVNGVLLRPLPYEDPDELVMVWQDHTRIDGPIDEWASPDNFFDWRDGNDVLAGIFVIGGYGPTLTGLDEPEILSGAAVSHDAFRIMGVEPVFGRGFLPEEDTSTSEPVVVIGHDFWTRRFNADEAIVGSVITLNGVPSTIVGVMPPGFAFPVAEGPDVFAPIGLDATNSCGRGCVTLRSIARLGPGVNLQQAQSSMDALAARLEAEYPGPNGGVGIYLEPLHERVVGPIRAGLWMLLGAVGLVLLIACVNVANLMLARATARQREVAIRTAIGAGRSRIFRQMLTESLLLAVGGAVVGLLLALWGTDLLVSLTPDGAPRLDEVSVDTTALLFTLAIAVMTGLLFGVAPALRASRPQLGASLKDGSHGAGSALGGLRVRGALVVAEVALAMTLLIGGGLLVRSFMTLTSVDPGFEADNLLTQQVFLPSTSYEGDPEIVAFVDEMVQRAATLPGVASAGVISTLPLGGRNEDSGFLIDGRPRPREGERAPVAWLRSVTPGYLESMKMRLVRGRWIEERDDAAAPAVVMINEAAARRYWDAGEPLGRRITFDGENWAEVVGITADTRHFALEQSERPAVYLPMHQSPRRFMSLVVRTDGDPMQLARSVQAEAWEIDRDLAFSGVATMREVVAGAVAVPRLLTSVLAAFAVAAMALAAIGIYGVMSYNVGQRTQEIGVRIALGAEPAGVRRLVVGRGMALLSVGILIGGAVSLVLARFVEGLLYGISARDPLTFAVVSSGLIATAFVACYVPALRASRVDPIVALRQD